MIFAIVILLIILIILGLPLFIGILAATMLGLYVSQVEFGAIPIEIFRLANAPVLLAIPLFTASWRSWSSCSGVMCLFHCHYWGDRRYHYCPWWATFPCPSLREL